MVERLENNTPFFERSAGWASSHKNHVRLSKRRSRSKGTLPFRKGRGAREFPGDLSERATPVPIPNTAVKPLSDGSSWSEGACEISASPGYRLRMGPRSWKGEGALRAFMGSEFPEKNSGEESCPAPHRRKDTGACSTGELHFQTAEDQTSSLQEVSRKEAEGLTRGLGIWKNLNSRDN